MKIKILLILAALAILTIVVIKGLNYSRGWEKQISHSISMDTI